MAKTRPDAATIKCHWHERRKRIQNAATPKCPRHEESATREQSPPGEESTFPRCQTSRWKFHPMRALPLLLAGVALASFGCSWFSQSTRSQFDRSAAPHKSERPITPEFAPDRDDSQFKGAPVIPDPNAYLPPRISLGAPSFDPPPLATNTPRAVQSESVVAQTAVDPQWRDSFRSTQGRPIQTMQIGDGSVSVLVTASLAGDDPPSVETIDYLARLLASDPAYASGLKVTLVRNPNPDALAEHLSVNARGVDINRNFPSARFTAAPTSRTGPRPASEAETRALLRILGDERPQRVIHVRSKIQRRCLITTTDASISQFANLRQSANCDLTSFQGVYKAGSLEEFTTARLKADMVTIDIPAEEPNASSERGRLLLAAIHGGIAPDSLQRPPSNESDAPIAAQPSNRSGPATFTGKLESTTGPDGSRGYVQLLPPPPDEPAESGGDPRYFELPPAP
ncbi:MAG: hypothetical protein DWQ29_24445 [Planctomycetota bacterium]|nr:MAG: hypothetical protein DWQ29_24445 [Planctomycetota bacterium]